MTTTRRNLLTIAGGAAAALPFTPVPWKLADDVSIWSQNWSWTPVPNRGPLSVKYTACTLCPAGCGMKARCIGAQPISLAPVPQHPVSRGALCPLAFGAHQLPYHPRRVREVLRNGRPFALEAASSEIAARARTGRVTVLDEMPGRSASAVYARLMERGVYVVPRNRHAATLDVIAAVSGVPAEELGFDLENVRTVISFGAPVLDGWGTPGRLLALWKARKLRIVQVEPSLSRTATLADRWLPLRPGSEGAVARALAGFTPAADVPGLAEIAQELQDGGPVLAVSGGGFSARTERAIAAINVRFGMKGIVRRPSTASGKPLDQLDPASIDVLFIDHGPLGGWVTWDAIESKLAPSAVVVSLTPYRAGIAERAHYVIPAPAFLESTQDRGTPWDAASASYAFAPALLPTPRSCVDPADFVARVLGAESAGLEQQIASLYARGEGEVFIFDDAQSKAVKEFESADKLREAFLKGACWSDQRREAVACTIADPGPETPPAPGLLLAGIATPAVLPPLATKLDQESRVRRRAGRVYIHPQTASLRSGERVEIAQGASSFKATVELDASVSPGLVESVSNAPAAPVTIRRA